MYERKIVNTGLKRASIFILISIMIRAVVNRRPDNADSHSAMLAWKWLVRAPVADIPRKSVLRSTVQPAAAAVSTVGL